MGDLISRRPRTWKLRAKPLARKMEIESGLFSPAEVDAVQENWTSEVRPKGNFAEFCFLQNKIRQDVTLLIYSQDGKRWFFEIGGGFFIGNKEAYENWEKCAEEMRYLLVFGIEERTLPHDTDIAETEANLLSEADLIGDWALFDRPYKKTAWYRRGMWDRLERHVVRKQVAVF